MNVQDIRRKADEIRMKVLEFHYKTQQGHLGGSLSCVETLTCLYYFIMKPEDSFILSKGHSSSTLYVILNDKGKIQDNELYNLEEHPSLNREYGIEASTGSLGHGLSMALGMALANKEHTSFVLLSDGECDEGQVWEAARLASELKIRNLVAIVDCNGWRCFGRSDYKDLDKRFEAFGWKATWCDGHDIEELISKIKTDDKPQVILARTIKGKGVKEIEDKLISHYKRLDKLPAEIEK